MENLVIRLLPLRNQAFWVRYSGSTFLVGLAALLRMALHKNVHDYSFYFFVPAVFISSLLFGRNFGYWAIFLSVLLSVGLFTEPYYSLFVRDDNVIPLVLLLATCVGITEVTEALRRILDRVSHAEQENALLLRELEHRTKNNLQMVASVLGLQAKYAPGDSFNYPHLGSGFASFAPRAMSVSRERPRHRTVFPGGGSWVRAR